MEYFMFPLISAHFRSFPSVASGQAGAGCSLGPGMRTGFRPAPTCRRHGWVPVELAADFVFAGITGHLRALGSRLCGSGGWVWKFHVPAHFRALPPVRPGQAARWGLVWGRVSDPPLHAQTRFGRCRPGAGEGGQGRMLAEVEAGNFCGPLISAHFRSNSPIWGCRACLGPGQGSAWGAGWAGCSWHCQTWNVACLSGCPQLALSPPRRFCRSDALIVFMF